MQPIKIRSRSFRIHNDTPDGGSDSKTPVRSSYREYCKILLGQTLGRSGECASANISAATLSVYSIRGVIAARSRAVENHSLKFLPLILSMHRGPRPVLCGCTEPVRFIRYPWPDKKWNMRIRHLYEPCPVTMFNLTTMRRPTFLLPVDVKRFHRPYKFSLGKIQCTSWF